MKETRFARAGREAMQAPSVHSLVGPDRSDVGELASFASLLDLILLEEDLAKKKDCAEVERVGLQTRLTTSVFGILPSRAGSDGGSEGVSWQGTEGIPQILHEHRKDSCLQRLS